METDALFSTCAFALRNGDAIAYAFSYQSAIFLWLRFFIVLFYSYCLNLKSRGSFEDFSYTVNSNVLKNSLHRQGDIIWLL